MLAMLRMLLAASLLLLSFGGIAEARPFRVEQIPNGPVNGCLTCHQSPGGPRNAFGHTIEFDPRFLDMPGGNVLWQPALAAIDSDGDGRSNGAELLDPSGLWTTRPVHPGNPALVTQPGVIDPPPPNPVPALPLPSLLTLAGALLLLAKRAVAPSLSRTR